jgi:hypothetical protein
MGKRPWLRGRGQGKYGAQPTESSDGKRFPSKAEARRYEELRLMQQQGIITDLVLHPRWRFIINGQLLRTMSGRALIYTADTSYQRDGALVVEDVKGMLTRDAEIRIALMAVVHGIEVQLIGRRRKKR